MKRGARSFSFQTCKSSTSAYGTRTWLVAKIRFLNRPQGHRDPICDFGLRFSPLRFLPDDDDALAAGVSRQTVADYWKTVPSFHAGRGHDARVLQLVRRDARNDHGFPRNYPNRIRWFRQLHRPAANRRAGYGFSEGKHV